MGEADGEGLTEGVGVGAGVADGLNVTVGLGLANPGKVDVGVAVAAFCRPFPMTARAPTNSTTIAPMTISAPISRPTTDAPSFELRRLGWP